MKKHLPTILVVFMLVVGFGLLFYPDISTAWNGRIQHGLLNQYQVDVAAMEREAIEEQFRLADEFNAALSHLPAGSPLLIGPIAPLPDNYRQIINVNGTMGRIRIPNIGVDLPIFHTTTSSVLDRGVGHLEGTALPVGGESTHSALTAHTALPNARLFSDLEGNVQIGHFFFIDVLDRTLAYEVIQIDIVWPHEVELLRVIPGEDLITLITCTPYAVNTQRLLVRGSRVPYGTVIVAEDIEVAFTVVSVDTRVYIFLAFFMLFMIIFTVYQLINNGREKKDGGVRKPVSTPVPMSVPATAATTVGSEGAAEVSTIPLPTPPSKPPTMPLSTPPSKPPTMPLPTPTPKHPTMPLPTPTSKHPTMPLPAQALPYAAAPLPAVPQHTTAAMPPPLPLPTHQPSYRGDTATHTLPTAASTPTSASRLPVAAKPTRVKQLFAKPFSSKTIGIIAAVCASLIVLVGGLGFILRQPSQPINAQETIAGFVSRVDEYRATHNDRIVAEMIERWQASGELEIQDPDAFDEDPFTWLVASIKEHNRSLFESGQPSLPDPFSDSQANFNLSYFGFSDEEMIGFISIPSINVELPIFMGASSDNLRRGLAHLTNSSLPVGGQSTNAILAGYMYLGRSYVLNGIDRLVVGDNLQITNFYEILTYTIIDIQQIDPQHTEALKIQDGRDLVTLLAYQNGNAQRYMIVAQRN